MLFSAGLDLYRCNQCSEEFQNEIPTSIIPIGGACVFAGAGWKSVIANFFQGHWSFNIVGFAIAFGTLWLTYELVERMTNNAIHRGLCPNCGIKLEQIGGGFADGCMPNPWELLIYGLTIAYPYLALWIVAITR